MSPQFVDFDGDGDDDIVCGIYDGSPHISYWDNDREGYLQPVGILDKAGDRIVLNAWWNFAEKKWDRTDRCNPDGGAGRRSRRCGRPRVRLVADRESGAFCTADADTRSTDAPDPPRARPGARARVLAVRSRGRGL